DDGPGVRELLLAVDDARVVDAGVRAGDVEGLAALRGDNGECRGRDDVRVPQLLRCGRVDVCGVGGADRAGELRDGLAAHLEGGRQGVLGSLQVGVDG